MFIVLLRFSHNRHLAATWMAEHKAWLARGMQDAVFLLAGSIQPSQGGGILAHGTTLAQLQARVADDPFVREGVVDAEIVELAPSLTDPRLAFLVP